MKGYLTKTMSFSAGHVLRINSLSKEENLEIFGKCTRLHGHNYLVEITLFGDIDPINGMIINAAKLKSWMETAIMSQLDHRNIESDVEWFKTRPSTAENVAVFIWNEMLRVMPEEEKCKLFEVKLRETDTICVVYRGD